MSTRNPMNERYQDEGKPAGKTRKSAASAKPATKAAASVRMETKEKPKKGLFGGKSNPPAKKKSKEAPIDPKTLQHPDTPEYKKWHRIWIGAVISAIALTMIGLIARNLFDLGTVSIAMVVVGDAMLIGAVLIDVFKLSKIRNRYAQQVRADRSKVTKAQRAKEAAARKEALAKDERAQDLKAIQEGKAVQVEKKKRSLNPFSTKNV